MNNTTFTALVNDTIRTTSALLIAKGEEYAGSSDRLANFKRGSKLTGATPLQVAFIYAAKHYDSLSTYVRKDAEGFQQKLSEPIEGRLDDLINYCLLMKALIVENREEAEQDSRPITYTQPKKEEQPTPTVRVTSIFPTIS